MTPYSRPKVFHQEDIDAAVAEERARIVALLREEAQQDHTSQYGVDDPSGVLRDVADRIERGE